MQMYRPNNFNSQQGGLLANNKAPVKNLLNNEEINELRRKGYEINDLSFTNEQILKGRCCHKFENGDFAVSIDSENNAHCPICNSTFKLVDLEDSAYIGKLVEEVGSVIDTVKLVDVNISQPMQQYVDIKTMLTKLPLISKRAKKNFQDFTSSFNAPENIYGDSLSSRYSQLINQGQNFGMRQQYPMNGMGYQQQYVPMQQPVVNNMMQPGVPPMVSPTPVQQQVLTNEYGQAIYPNGELVLYRDAAGNTVDSLGNIIRQAQQPMAQQAVQQPVNAAMQYKLPIQQPLQQAVQQPTVDGRVVNTDPITGDRIQ